MGIFAVRLRDNNEAVGIFIGTKQSLFDLVDEYVDPHACDYKFVGQQGSVCFPLQTNNRFGTHKKSDDIEVIADWEPCDIGFGSGIALSIVEDGGWHPVSGLVKSIVRFEP